MRSPIEASAICNTIFSNKTSPPKYEDWNSVLKYQAKVMEDQNQYKSPRPNSALGQYTQNLIIQKPPVPQGPLFQKPDIQHNILGADSSKKELGVKPLSLGFFRIQNTKQQESKNTKPLQFGISKNQSHNSQRQLDMRGLVSSKTTHITTNPQDVTFNSQHKSTKSNSPSHSLLQQHVSKLASQIIQQKTQSSFYNQPQTCQVREIAQPSWQQSQQGNSQMTRQDQNHMSQQGQAAPTFQNNQQNSQPINNAINNGLNSQQTSFNGSMQSQQLLFSNVLPQQNQLSMAQNNPQNMPQNMSQNQQFQYQQQVEQNQQCQQFQQYQQYQQCQPLQFTQSNVPNMPPMQQFMQPNTQQFMQPSIPYSMSPFNQSSPPQPQWRQLYYQALSFNQQLILSAYKKFQQITQQKYKPTIQPPVRQLSPFRLDPIPKKQKKRQLLIVYSDEPFQPPVQKQIDFMPAFINRQTEVIHQCLYKVRILNQDGEQLTQLMEEYESTDEIETLRKNFRRKFKSVYGDCYTIHFGQLQDGKVVVMPVTAYKKMKDCPYECTYSARRQNIVRDLQLSNEFGSVMWPGNVDVEGVSFLSYPKIVENKVEFWENSPFSNGFVTLKLYLNSVKFFNEDGELDKERVQRVLKRQCHKQRVNFQSIDYDKMEWTFQVGQ